MKAVALLAGAVCLAGATDKKPDPVPVGPVSAAAGSKVVQYGDHDVVLISAKIRFTTLIQLPKNEQILEFICGDKEFWVVNGSQNFAFVKPAKVGSETNLNLITAAGNVYSFVLREVGDGTPDLKVFVEPRDNGFATAANGSPRFVPASAVDDWREQATMAREAARKANENAKEEIARAATQAQREKDEAISTTPPLCERTTASRLTTRSSRWRRCTGTAVSRTFARSPRRRRRSTRRRTGKRR